MAELFRVIANPIEGRHSIAPHGGCIVCIAERWKHRERGYWDDPKDRAAFIEGFVRNRFSHEGVCEGHEPDLAAVLLRIGGVG